MEQSLLTRREGRMRYSVPSCKSATSQGFHSGIPEGATIARLTWNGMLRPHVENPKNEDGYSGSLVVGA